jgi:hypothetical protein
MQAESLAEVNHVLKQTEQKANAQAQEKMAHEQKLAEEANQSMIMQKQMELDRQSLEKEKDRRRDLLVAEIKASGFGAMQDMNANSQSDFMDAMEQIKSTQEFQETMNFERDKQSTNTQLQNQKQQLDKAKLDAQMAMKNMDLQIARENKNQFDIKKANDKKNSDKKKK